MQQALLLQQQQAQPPLFPGQHHPHPGLLAAPQVGLISRLSGSIDVTGVTSVGWESTIDGVLIWGFRRLREPVGFGGFGSDLWILFGLFGVSRLRFSAGILGFSSVLRSGMSIASPFVAILGSTLWMRPFVAILGCGSSLRVTSLKFLLGFGDMFSSG
jgi:hypothetical protein